MHTSRAYLPYVISSVGTLFLLTILVGCGGAETKRASGTLKVNGKLVSSGAVEFYPIEGGRTGNGVIEPDGTFEVSYVKPGDGLPPGKYKVGIIADVLVQSARDKKADAQAEEDGDSEAVVSGKVKPLVPRIYNNITTTPYEIEIVDDGKAQFIELEINTKGGK